MQKSIKNRRRNYFIDKSFQTKFIVKFCLLITATSLLTGILIYWFNRQSTTVAFENLKVIVKPTSDFLLPIILQILVVVTLLVGLATIAVALFTSHKIAGPLYRLKMGIEKVKNGDLSTSFTIRTNDQLQIVATEFDDMRRGLKNSIGTMKENWHSAKEHMLKLQQETKDTKQKARIEDVIKKIDSELERFKTD